MSLKAEKQLRNGSICWEGGVRRLRRRGVWTVTLLYPPSLAFYATLTHCHKLRGLKQHRVIILWCHRSEVWQRSRWAQGKASRENPFPCLFQLLKVIRVPWLVASFLHLRRQQRHISLAFHLSLPLSNCSQAKFSTLKFIWLDQAHPNNPG